MAPVEPLGHRLVALIVEAEPVDDGAVRAEPEEPRPRIAGLRQRRHRADLDEAETEAEHRVRHRAVLVEAGGEPDRVGEGEAERLDGEPRIAGLRRGADAAEAGRFDGQMVGPFRIEQPQNPRRAVAEGHARSAGKTWRPSGPSGRSSTLRTAESGSGA